MLFQLHGSPPIRHIRLTVGQAMDTTRRKVRLAPIGCPEARRSRGATARTEICYPGSMSLPYLPGGLYVQPWPPVLVTRGPGSLRELHSHHAMHFVLALGGDLRARGSRHARWT